MGSQISEVITGKALILRVLSFLQTWNKGFSTMSLGVQIQEINAETQTQRTL